MMSFEECRKLEARPKITKEVRILNKTKENPHFFVDFVYNVSEDKSHAWFIVNIPIEELLELEMPDFLVVARMLFMSTLTRNFKQEPNFVCNFFFLDKSQCRKLAIKFWQNFDQDFDDHVLSDEFINLSPEFLTLFKLLKT